MSRGIGRSAINALVTLGVVLALWQAVVSLTGISPYVAKGPAQVWVVDPGSNEILASVSVFRGPDGWFVDGVMTCS